MRQVEAYVHHDGSVGVMAVFKVGSDFTARTDDFKRFSRTVLMSLAFHARELTVGEDGEMVVDPSSVAWVGDEGYANIAEALEAAETLFQEKVTLAEIELLQR